MAATAQKSVQAAAFVANAMVDARDRARVQRIHFKFTQSGTGDQNSTADLCYLPPGKNRVCLASSAISTPAIVNGQCDVGHTGFTKPDGTVVSAAPTAFQANKTITSALIWAPGAAVAFDYESRDYVLVQLTFDGTGGAVDGNVVEGWFDVAVGGG